MYTGKTWPREEIELNDQFVFMVAREINNDTPDPLTVVEAQIRADWPQWKAAIKFELDSLIKRQVFGTLKPIQGDTTYTGYKFTFVCKHNA